MNKWIVLFVLTVAIIITFSLWSCCVVAGEADEQMEEMMKRDKDEAN